MERRNRTRAIGWAAAATVAYAGWQALQRARQIDLAGRVVLITGGSRGLGLVLARQFAVEGCRLVICARDQAELDAAQRDLEGRGADVLARRCDVAERAEVEALIGEATRHFGRVDVLVNNAGIIEVGPIEVTRVEDFERVLRVNFLGSLHAAFAVLPQMRERGNGRIVNITSIGGKVAVPHLLPYDCAKFALVGLSEGLRAEVAKDGISVTTIVPGLMRTGSPPHALFKGDHDAEWTWFSLGSATPLSAISARRAARRIVLATKRGEAEVTLSWQAKALRLTHDLFPGATADLLGWVNRMLPSAPGNVPEQSEPRRGMELSSPLSPSAATTLMNRAAPENNEYAGQPRPSPEHASGANLANQIE